METGQKNRDQEKSSNPPAEERVPLLPLLTVNFIGTLGFSIVLPFLVFLVNRLGGNAFVYGLASSMYPAFQLIGAPILDRWSDIYGRKKILHYPRKRQKQKFRENIDLLKSRIYSRPCSCRAFKHDRIWRSGSSPWGSGNFPNRGFTYSILYSREQRVFA